MALAKDRNVKDIETRINYFGGGGPSMQALEHASSLKLFGYKGSATPLHANVNMLVDGESSGSPGSYSNSLLPILSDPSNSSSSGYPFVAFHSLPAPDARTTGQWLDDSYFGSSSLLCFDQGGERGPNAGFVSTDHEDESPLWIDAMDHSNQMSYLQNQNKHGAIDHSQSSRMIQDQSCVKMARGYGSSSATSRDKRCWEDRLGLLYSGASGTIIDRSVVQESSGQRQGPKRPCTDGGMQLPSPKKHCSANRKNKDKPNPSHDQQSLAAKNRRERISERLKVLQDLVPNGTKVDLVTMLEKAITYVKFLQLQVKVLATDEFWPARGGKAPELSQVKEAIDAILSSQRERTPSFKKSNI